MLKQAEVFLYLNNIIVFCPSNHPFLRPDYPFKIFADKRNEYVLLMESLAADPQSPIPLS
jgi:hypothetical protein